MKLQCDMKSHVTALIYSMIFLLDLSKSQEGPDPIPCKEISLVMLEGRAVVP